MGEQVPPNCTKLDAVFVGRVGRFPTVAHNEVLADVREVEHLLESRCKSINVATVPTFCTHFLMGTESGFM